MATSEEVNKTVPTAEPKNISRKWEVREFKDGYGCVLTECEEGKNANATKTTGVFDSVLTGQDVALIASTCSRFALDVAGYTEWCRRHDSHRIAIAQCERLNRELENGNR